MIATPILILNFKIYEFSQLLFQIRNNGSKTAQNTKNFFDRCVDVVKDLDRCVFKSA